jgi:putative Ca2+/H+ antiporter (TMEM165/GDT1 family)
MLASAVLLARHGGRGPCVATSAPAWRDHRRARLSVGRCVPPIDRHPTSPMDAFLLSTLAVTLAEIGDKTQLLALMLAVRYRQPWPIVAGILVATLVNHTLAAAVGTWVRAVVDPDVLRWIVAACFFGVAVWTLIPDKLDEDEVKAPIGRFGVFGVTALAFFLAEMGDKTQIATAVLGARYEPLWAVVAGTTLGMLIADVPAVFAGHLAADRIPLKAVRIAAALLFAGLGVGILWRG